MMGEEMPFKPQVKNLTLDENAPLWPQAPPDVEGSYARAKSRMWLLFEEPDTARAALWINIYVLALILLSAIIAVIETIPGIHRESPDAWLATEAFFVVNFSIELGLRFWACRDKQEFVTSGMNWIDFISIAPFYLELIIDQATNEGELNLKFLRILRLGRALRLVKLVRFSTGMQMIKHCISKSMDALTLFGFIFGMLLQDEDAAAEEEEPESRYPSDAVESISHVVNDAEAHITDDVVNVSKALLSVIDLLDKSPTILDDGNGAVKKRNGEANAEGHKVTDNPLAALDEVPWHLAFDIEFSQVDTNKDGKISRDEWVDRYGTEKGFDAYDVDGDGVVDASEFRLGNLTQSSPVFKPSETPQKKGIEKKHLDLIEGVLTKVRCHFEKIHMQLR